MIVTARYHHDAVYIPAVDGGLGPYDAKAVIAKGGEELLGRGAVVAEPEGTVPLEVPTRQVQPTDLLQGLLAIHRREVLLLVDIGGGSEGYLPFDYRAGGVAEANLVIGTSWVLATDA